jgi:hypothetical protein
MKKELQNIKGIRTVKDLMKATIKEDATFANGGYNLFAEEIKKYLICKGGKLMLWEDWYKKPHPRISVTIDAEFEIVEAKQLPEPKEKP